VRTGTFWYRAACAERGIDGEAYFLTIVEKFRPRRGGIGPIDHAGRRAAGFSERELEAVAATPPSPRTQHDGRLPTRTSSLELTSRSSVDIPRD
jgi:hypothetical protein